MKFKMAPNSLFAILLRKPWWVSFLIVGVISLLCLALLPPGWVVFGIMGTFPFMVTGAVALHRQWDAPSQAQMDRQLEQAAGQNWRAFSKDLEARFLAQGFTVEPLPPSKTEGRADFKLSKGGKTTLVAARRYKAATHGVEHVQALIAHQREEGADAAMLVCLSPLSEQAARLAKEHGMTLGLPQAKTGRGWR